MLTKLLSNLPGRVAHRRPDCETRSGIPNSGEIVAVWITEEHRQMPPPCVPCRIAIALRARRSGHVWMEWLEDFAVDAELIGDQPQYGMQDK